jgi:hypothetical protein
VQRRIEHFDVGIGFDVAGGDLARARLRDSERLRLVAVKLERHLLQIKDDVGGVLHDPLNRREFVFDALDLDRRNCRAFDRRKQCAPQRVTDRGAKAALERLGREAAVTLGQCFAVSR